MYHNFFPFISGDSSKFWSTPSDNETSFKSNSTSTSSQSNSSSHSRPLLSPSKLGCVDFRKSPSVACESCEIKNSL